MAIGPTGASPLPPVPQAQGGSIASSRSARGPQEAFGFRGRNAVFEEALKAEPLDEADRRQFNRELTASQIHQLQPNAPRGSIVDIVV